MARIPSKRPAGSASAATVDAIRSLSVLSRDIALTSQNLESSLTALLERAARETKMDALAVWTIEPAGGTFVVRESVGLSPRFIRYFNKTDRMRRTHGLFAECIADGAVRAIESGERLDELGTERWKKMFAEENIGALLAVPMHIGDEAIGILTVMHRSAHAFDDWERFFFGVLANQIAVALRNSENYRSVEGNTEELESQISKLTHLQDAFQSINQYLNESVDHALAFLADYGARTFRSTGAAILEPSGDGATLALSASHGLSEGFRAFMRDDPPRSGARDTLIALAFDTQKPQLSERVFTDDRIARPFVRMLSEDRLTAEAAFPLLSGRKAFGVLAVYYDHRHPFTDEETSVLGAFSQFLGILFENQKTLTSLVSEKQKTQSIVYSLRDGLLVYDLSGAVADINPRGADILGVDPDEVLDRNRAAGAEGSKGLENIKIISSVAIPDYETRLVMLVYPRETALEVTHVPLYRETRVKTGSLRILHDVTADRRVEQLKSNFVSTATHQLRTPLTGIRWGLEKLLGETGLTNDSHGMVEQLLGTTHFMISLVNDLLNVSQLEEGKKQYHFEKQSVVPMIKTVVDGFAVYVKNKHLTLRVEYPENGAVPEVTVDRSMMTLALQNLIDNAIKYTPEGGSVTISVEPRSASLLISVRDSGIGIPREDVPFLFNKFFRSKNAVRMETAGSGLGLFLAKNIVNDHNGRLTADSEPGKGSTFTIQLPLEDALAPIAHAHGDNPSSPA